MRIILLIFLFTSNLYSQVSAVTENGDEVILYDDNSWIYKNKNSNNDLSLLNSTKIYSYDKNFHFLSEK